MKIQLSTKQLNDIATSLNPKVIHDYVKNNYSEYLEFLKQEDKEQSKNKKSKFFYGSFILETVAIRKGELDYEYF